MFRILQLRDYNKANLVNREFESSKVYYKESVKKLIEYYTINGSHLISEHILYKILYTISNYRGNTLDRVRKVKSDIDNIAGALGITTYINVGKIHKSEFYSNQCIIVSVEFEPIIILLDNWKEYRPVRVLTHPFTTLNYTLPPMGDKISTIGNTVVGIDIPMLTAMFYKWGIEDRKKPVDKRESVEEFITKYVLPGMLIEHYDISIRNRLFKLANGEAINNVPCIPVISLPSYVDRLDNGLTDVIGDIRVNSNNSLNDLSRIPMLYANNYYEAIPQWFKTLIPAGYWASQEISIDWLFVIANILPNVVRTSQCKKILMRSVNHMKNNHSMQYLNDSQLPIFNAKLDYILDILK